MPQYDLYHNTVKNALIKDGWVITDDPFTIKFEDLRLFADLAAEKLIAAEKDKRRIVVEIKTFKSPSLITELERAVGQYGIYRTLLKQAPPEREIYLAIDEETYENFFQQLASQTIINDHRIKLRIFESNSEEILQWIS
ncbi:MAG TPA: fatty-acid synthase [Cyanobacteria bacterium UBA11369]|nr:fatty-acid synthase [Cyanobacteria bacterium UBA11371]HBE30714.1 fatty-acid synthase [Cyanobacteria bacterium UBA11368]HBE49370.1 fatty-acid synthase [Cyanobacteria bacterium UBA11369]